MILFQYILSLFNALGGAASLLLLLVPVGRIIFTYPEQSVLALQCPTSAEGKLDRAGKDFFVLLLRPEHFLQFVLSGFNS